MAFSANETFDDGLEDVTVDYATDTGKTVKCTVRKAYLDAGLISMTSPATATSRKPKGLQPRHMYIQATVRNAKGKFPRRKVISDIASIQRLFAPGATPAPIAIDGQNWMPIGFKGESQRAE